MERYGHDSCKSKQGTVAGCSENCNQLRAFVKFWETLSVKFGNNFLVAMDSGSWSSLISLILILDLQKLSVVELRSISIVIEYLVCHYIRRSL